MSTKLISLNGKYEKIEITKDVNQVVLEVAESNASKHLDVVLSEEGAEVAILGVYVGLGTQKIELVVNAIHKAPNTKCLTQIRGVLKDSAFSSFKGMIKIEKAAQKTNSYLDDDVLILGRGARNQSEPTLEIEADDVKATHGATTGRIPEESLFYLESRGVSRSDAQNIIVEGFLQQVIEKIEDEKVKDGVYTKIKSRLLS